MMVNKDQQSGDRSPPPLMLARSSSCTSWLNVLKADKRAISPPPAKRSKPLIASSSEAGRAWIRHRPARYPVLSPVALEKEVLGRESMTQDTIFVRFSSHRARQKGLARLQDNHEAHYSFERRSHGGYYKITSGDFERLKAANVKGWTRLSGPYGDLRHCW